MSVTRSSSSSVPCSASWNARTMIGILMTLWLLKASSALTAASSPVFKCLTCHTGSSGKRAKRVLERPRQQRLACVAATAGTTRVSSTLRVRTGALDTAGGMLAPDCLGPAKPRLPSVRKRASAGATRRQQSTGQAAVRAPASCDTALAGGDDAPDDTSARAQRIEDSENICRIYFAIRGSQAWMRELCPLPQLFAMRQASAGPGIRSARARFDAQGHQCAGSIEATRRCRPVSRLT